jgi:hypothetical protein
MFTEAFTERRILSPNFRRLQAGDEINRRKIDTSTADYLNAGNLGYQGVRQILQSFSTGILYGLNRGSNPYLGGNLPGAGYGGGNPFHRGGSS